MNVGRDLEKTTKSVDHQIGALFEHILKDEGSKEGSILALPSTPHRAAFVEPDCGIHDAMNQALKPSCSVYVIFMDAGNGLARLDTLQVVVSAAKNSGLSENIYKDCHNEKLRHEVRFPARLARRFFFRPVSCDQAL